MIDMKNIVTVKSLKMPEARYNRFEELVNLLPQAVLEVRFDGIIFFANWHCKKLFGYNIDEEITGSKNVLEHIHPSDHEVIIKRMAKLLSGGNARPPEITAVRKDGTTFPAIVYANLIMSEGEPWGVRVVIADITEKKEVEEAYKALVDHSLQALIIIQDERPVFVNDYLVHESGLTREEILSLPSEAMWQMIHPEDREAVMKMHHNLLSGRLQRAPLMEYRVFISGKDGPELKWVSDYGARIEYRGRPAVQTAFVDITERKISEIALRESEKKYRDLAELLPQGIFEADGEGRITYANRSALDMYGVTPGYLCKGFTTADIVMPEERDRIVNMLECLLSGKKVGSEEYACIRKDGSVFPALIVANTVVKDDVCIGIRGVVADITLQKEMVTRLEESEGRYRALFNSTGTATILIEADMTISFANEEFYRFSGYQRETKQKFHSLIHPEDRRMVMNYHRNRRRDAGYAPGSYEFRYIRPDGDTGSAFATVGMIPGTTKSVASIVDITNLKHIQEELRIKSINLEEANTALRVILRHKEEDEAEMERNVMTNLQEGVFPFLDKLKSHILDQPQMQILTLMENNLKKVTSPFLKSVAAKYPKLTPREIEILIFIKEGHSTKDIALMLNTSSRTIDFHRNSIRKKLGIANNKINLRTFVLSHQDIFK